jgi:GT2 family glycosyltransferase
MKHVRDNFPMSPSPEQRTCSDEGDLPMPEASVVVPAHNAQSHLRECLKCLGESQGCRYEIIVVDDGSTDDTARVAAEMGARVIQLDETMGPAVARNRGVANARAEIVVFIDADVLVAPSTLSQLVATLHDSDYDAVFGSYDSMPSAGNLISQYKNLLHHHTHQQANLEASTFWSGCGAVRRKQFLEIGGFDESYSCPSIEDIEFGARLKRNGEQIRLDPNIQVTHAKHWTISSLIKTDVFARAIPWTRLILQQHSLPNDLNLKVSQRICVAMSGVMILLAALACWMQPVLILVIAATVAAVRCTDHASGTPGRNRLAVLTGVFALLVLFVAACTLAPGLIAIMAFLGAIMLLLNLSLFRFFAGHRGLAFAFLSVPLHVLYYCYSGTAFGLGCMAHIGESLHFEKSED